MSQKEDFSIRAMTLQSQVLIRFTFIPTCLELRLLSFSFQSDISLGETTTLVKSVSDTDAKHLVVLPKGVN